MTSRVLVALRVDVAPVRAFDAFVNEIGTWWRPNGLFQTGPGAPGTLAFQGGADGVLVETREDGEAYTIGRVLAWQPPERLVFSWHQANFPDGLDTEVEVRFDPADDGTTRVSVEHRGFTRVPADSVARHGFPDAALQMRLAEWWRRLLASLAATVAIQPRLADHRRPPTGSVAMEEINVEHHGHVVLVEINRPPNNFFDVKLINGLADLFEELDADPEVRALVLASAGKHFCAGANFSDSGAQAERRERRVEDGNPLYTAGARLFACKKPVVGAIQGAAVGGGFGLALVPDFRVVCPEARFTANFVKLGFHPGFGLTWTLPRLIGQQKAALMFMTGRRIDGTTAHQWGLADVLTEQANVRTAALELAGEIAENAPLATLSVRATLRDGIAESVKAQTDHEFVEQFRLQQTEDHKEGVRAVAERRPGNFKGR